MAYEIPTFVMHPRWYTHASAPSLSPYLAAHTHSKSPELRRKTFEAMIGVMSLRRWGDCGDHESFLCRWFLGTVSSARDIRRGNATQWLAWSYFYRLPPMLNAEERSELDDMVGCRSLQVAVYPHLSIANPLTLRLPLPSRLISVHPLAR
jgi:hypothetical protein